MLAWSTDSQTNNYRSYWCWEESKPSIEKQMFIICSILFSFLSFFFKFTINSWRDIYLSSLFVYHILGETENQTGHYSCVYCYFLKSLSPQYYCYSFWSECSKWACTYKIKTLWLISKRSKMFLLLCTNRSMHGFNHIVECILHI